MEKYKIEVIFNFAKLITKSDMKLIDEAIYQIIRDALNEHDAKVQNIETQIFIERIAN